MYSFPFIAQKAKSKKKKKKMKEATKERRRRRRKIKKKWSMEAHKINPTSSHNAFQVHSIFGVLQKYGLHCLHEHTGTVSRSTHSHVRIGKKKQRQQRK